jgi:chromosome partitioning protein
MPRVAIFNCKGGVGKTTTALNLGAALRRAGEAPRLLDLDPQGHLTRIFGKASKDVARSLYAFYQDSIPLQSLQVEWEGIGSLLPSHGMLMKVDSVFGKGPTILNKLRLGLDALDATDSVPRLTLIDCCPYVGVLSLNALFAADVLLVPVSTDYLSLQGARQIEQTLKAIEPVLKRRLPRRFVLTRFDRRRRMSGRIDDEIRAAFGADVCATQIAENVSVAESPSLGRDVFAHQPDSHGARDYSALFAELRAEGLV